MTNPLHTLREALGEANNALGWASSMLIEGVEFYTVREVLHAAQKDAMKCHQALTRAESALRELERVQKQVSAEAEPRYTAEQFFDALDEELELDKLDPLYSAYREATKRRLAERGEKNG